MRLLLTGLALTLVACAAGLSKPDEKLDAKIAAETEMRDRRDVQVEADYLIRTSDSLSEKQKQALLQLRESTKTRMDKLLEESVKLRAALLRTVLGSEYKPKDIAVLKGRMRSLEDEKLALIFAAIDQANKIIGRGRDVNGKIFDEFFIFDTMRVTH